MKKLLTITLTLIIALSCLLMGGCGVKGDYTLKYLKAGNTQYNIGEDYKGEELTSGYVVLSLDDDDQASLIIGNLTLTGTWKISEEDDDELILQLGAVRIYAEMDDKELDFTYLGVTYTMSKV